VENINDSKKIDKTFDFPSEKWYDKNPLLSLKKEYRVKKAMENYKLRTMSEKELGAWILTNNGHWNELDKNSKMDFRLLFCQKNKNTGNLKKRDC
jgi:hypothetical protein